MTHPIVLSYVQAKALLQARQAGESSTITSPDLGLTTVTVAIEAAGIRFPSGEFIAWDAIERIAATEQSCFLIDRGSARKIQTFSEHTNRPISLMPTQRAPTLLIAGFPMHRIKDIDPYEDTRRKIQAIAPITGRVLDTATGLGYTALEAAKTAEEVVTIELDPAVLEIARLNPWSRTLFDHPRIVQIIGDSFEEVQRLEDASFSCIIHDPPTFSLAGDLYSAAFYRELFRVLKPGGRLLHYIGDLRSKAGRSIAPGVIRRLREAGFRRVVRRPEAFSLVAYKESS